MKWSTSWEPLRHAPFRYLAAGRAVTMLGNAVAPIALAFAVLDLTGSVRDLGLVVGARSLANVVFVLLGGVVADRLPRQLVMVASCMLAAASQGAVATLILTDAATIGLLIALASVNGMVSAFAFPAAGALMPQTVPPEIRKQANAITRLGINASMIAGAAAGGLLVAMVGPGWGLAVDALAFAVAGALFSLVRVPAYRDANGRVTSTWHELREGWREFVAHTWVWVVVVGACFFNMAMAGGLQVLGPAIADETFGRSAWGLILAAQTAGMVVGAVIMMRIRVRRMLLLGSISMLVAVPVLVALALAPRVVVLAPLAFAAGIAIEQFGIGWETSLQDHIAAEKLARVYSYDLFGSIIAMPIGQVAVGPIAEAVGNETAVLIAAAVAGLALLGILASRQVRSLRPVTAPPANGGPNARAPVPLT
jgi:MFS family permease